MDVDVARADAQTALTALTNAVAVSTVRFDRASFTDLTFLPPGAPIAELVLASATRLTSLEGIEHLAPTLRSLHLRHCPRLHDIEPIAALSGLRHFSFNLASSATSSHKIASLAPLANLTELQEIVMIGVGASDGDLSPLFGLQHLDTIRLPNYYSLEQTARLAGAVPLAAAVGLPALTEHKHVGGGCPRCGNLTQVMLRGRRRGTFVCPTCDAGKIEKHLYEFDRYRVRQQDASRA